MKNTRKGFKLTPTDKDKHIAELDRNVTYYAKRASHAECQNRDIVLKITMFGTTLDIGVVAEYDNGERIWCHTSSEHIKSLLDKKFVRGLWVIHR